MSVERFRAAQAAKDAVLAQQREAECKELEARRGKYRGLRRGDRRSTQYRHRNAERMRGYWQRRARELGIGV